MHRIEAPPPHYTARMPQPTDRARELRANILVVALLVAVAVAAFVVTVGVRTDWFSGDSGAPEIDDTLDEPVRVFVLESDEDAMPHDLDAVASVVSNRLFAVGLTRIRVDVEGEQVIVQIPQAYLHDESFPDLDEILTASGRVSFAPVLDDDQDDEDPDTVVLGDARVEHDIVWGLRLEPLGDDTWTLAVDLDINVDSPWPELIEEACDGDDPRIAAVYDTDIVVVTELRTRQCREAQTLAPQFGSFEEPEARRLAGLLTSPVLAVSVELVDTYDS